MGSLQPVPMMESLEHIDRQVFTLLNGLHSPWMDTVMSWLTMGVLWLPLYLLLVYLVIRTYHWKTLWVLVFAALMLTASDQLSVLIKGEVMRLRPSQDPTLCCVHLVNGYKGGLYGFYSSHASNTLSIAVLVIILLRKYFPFVIPLMILWACLMSYTRIYLGVHYPGDILAGMIVGFILGTIFGLACRRVLLISRTYS